MNFRFEFDPQKSTSNKTKQGIDFHVAQALWRGRLVESTAQSKDGEMRYANYGKIGDEYWTAIVTYRAGVCRIISVYPSNPRQIEQYERAGQPPAP